MSLFRSPRMRRRGATFTETARNVLLAAASLFVLIIALGLAEAAGVVS